jgi:hypothetical protein
MRVTRRWRMVAALVVLSLLIAAVLVAGVLTAGGASPPTPTVAPQTSSGTHGPLDADGDRDVRKNGAYNPKFSDGDSDDPA